MRSQKGSGKHKWNMGKVKSEKQKDQTKTHIEKAERDWKKKEEKNVHQVMNYKFSKETEKVGT